MKLPGPRLSTRRSLLRQVPFLKGELICNLSMCSCKCAASLIGGSLNIFVINNALDP